MNLSAGTITGGSPLNPKSIYGEAMGEGNPLKRRRRCVVREEHVGSDGAKAEALSLISHTHNVVPVPYVESSVTHVYAYIFIYIYIVI